MVYKETLLGSVPSCLSHIQKLCQGMKFMPLGCLKIHYILSFTYKRWGIYVSMTQSCDMCLCSHIKAYWRLFCQARSLGQGRECCWFIELFDSQFFKNERYGIVGLSVRSEKAVSDPQTHSGGISPSEITDARTKMCSESSTHYTVS